MGDVDRLDLASIASRKWRGPSVPGVEAELPLPELPRGDNEICIEIVSKLRNESVIPSFS